MNNAAIQKSLFQDGDRQITFIPSVDVDLIEVSKYNPRKTWDDAHVNRLAQLIESNGFDTAFALKCHKENDGLRCFAGSNRLKAARKAGKQFVPVFLYEGYEGREIWRMAYEDNEQADAQQQFSVVDVWEDYLEKKDLFNWTQEQLSAFLNVSQPQVTRRLQYADFPKSALYLFRINTKLRESHARELLPLFQWNKGEYSNALFPLQEIIPELINKVTSRYTNPTAQNFSNKVDEYLAAFEAAKKALQVLDDKHKDIFIGRIKDERKAAIIERIGLQVYNEQAEEEQDKWDGIILVNGDSLETCNSAPNGIKLIFTDPPYGKDYQNNYRSNPKHHKINNDSEEKEAIELTRNILLSLLPKMAKDSAVLLWCGWESEPGFRGMIKDLGFELKNSIVWVKNNHGTGDLTGTFAPKHERLLYATKGRVNITNRLPDVLSGSVFVGKGQHPTPKPIDLIKLIIASVTLPGDIVADPFMGTCATGVSCVETGRKFWGCELSKDYFDFSYSNISEAIDKI